jgi:hypothetical protein
VGEIRSANKVLVGKPYGTGPFRRPKHRWKHSIKPHLKETGWEGIDWINLTQYRDWWWALVNMVINVDVSFVGCSAT